MVWHRQVCRKAGIRYVWQWGEERDGGIGIRKVMRWGRVMEGLQ